MIYAGLSRNSGFSETLRRGHRTWDETRPRPVTRGAWGEEPKKWGGKGEKRGKEWFH